MGEVLDMPPALRLAWHGWASRHPSLEQCIAILGTLVAGLAGAKSVPMDLFGDWLYTAGDRKRILDEQALASLAALGAAGQIQRSTDTEGG